MTAVNLCFHGVGEPQRNLEPGERDYWISVDLLHSVLDLVAEVSERREVGLSFDDGNLSDYQIGLPALRERGLRATFFPIAARIDTAGSTGSEHLRELVGAGMSIGSHGMRHRPWRGMPDAELDEELVSARQAIAGASGVPVTTAACPLGRYDRRVLGRLRRLGYTRVFTSDRATARAASWLQPRFSLREDDTVESVTATLNTVPSIGSKIAASGRIAVKRLR